MIPASTNQLLTANTGYRISRSLRFRSSASAYLKLANGTPTSAQKWTWSAWVKRGTLGAQVNISGAGQTSGTNYAAIIFNSNGTFQYNEDTTATNLVIVTTQVFRDPSAWYHVVLVVDTTSATNTITGGSTDRIRLYVNGVQVTSFATGGNLNVPSQNYNTYFNSSGYTKALGNIWYNNGPGGYYFDGYLAEVNFIDGQALTPSSFGAFDTNGVWQPAKYTGSYGTNGFYLNFSDNSGATATTIGKDSSGNSNNWTPNNISVTSGTTYDSMIDSPTNYADGGNGRGNYPTLSPLQVTAASIGTASDGNLSWSATGTATYAKIYSTMALPTSGKWYWEVVAGSTANLEVSIISASDQTTYYPGYSSVGYSYYQNTGQKVNNNVFSTYGSSYTTNDVIGIAFDADNGALYFAKNNTWQNSGVPTSGASKTGAAFTNLTGTYVAALGNGASSVSTSAKINFGQQPFTYTPPSGFSALNTQNLPTPTIAAGNKYFDALLYAGNGSSSQRTDISWTNMQPDFVWIKNRITAVDHVLSDDVRGVTNYLASDTTAAEAGPGGYGTDGFGYNGVSNQLRIFTSDSRWNASSANYVAWGWKGSGAAGVSNTSGSITSTVSANTSAGFSVVTGQSSGTTGSVSYGHGLGVTPSMVIFKTRDITSNWAVWHTGIGSSVSGNYILLNTTGAAAVASTFWGGTGYGITSTTVGIDQQYFATAANQKFVMYCFAPVAGYSAFGSYTGNGSADGPFVYCGFRPRWVLVKYTGTSSAYTSWYIIDTSREPYNISSGTVPDLWANLSASEGYRGNGSTVDTYNYVDVLSNGFKVRANNTDELNISGGTYIYAAFCELPFKTSRAR